MSNQAEAAKESTQLQKWFWPSPKSSKPDGMRRELWPLVLGFGYISIVAGLGHLTSDHVFIGLLCLLDLYNFKSRQFVRYFFPFILTGVIFDSLRYFYHPLTDGRVHVGEPYFRDLKYFGINTVVDGLPKRLTPNEYFRIHHSVAIDLLCGAAYLTFVAEYLSAAFFLFLKNKMETLRAFGFAFLSINLLGFITYFIYPASPPWYVTKFGLGTARMDIAPDAAAAHRFDSYLGVHFFEQMYGRGVIVHGAYPSLHVTYPLLVAWVCFLVPSLRWARLPALAFYGLMCFSAIYLQHHYVVDILLGSLYAVGIAAGITFILKRQTKT